MKLVLVTVKRRRSKSNPQRCYLSWSGTIREIGCRIVRSKTFRANMEVIRNVESTCRTLSMLPVYVQAPKSEASVA